MKAKRLIINNQEELLEHERLGLPKEPTKDYALMDYWFRVESVSAAYLTIDGFIAITIQGTQVFIQKTPKVWSKIRNWLSD